MYNREQYLSTITDRIKKIAEHNKEIQRYAQELNKRHNIPLGMSTDFLNLRNNIISAEPEVAYAIGELFLNVGDYYTPSEIERYKNWKYVYEKLPKTLEFEMVQITEEHWIGRITVEELMKLRNAQIINYNENTQRVMRHINKGHEEILQITLNKKAILEMESLFKQGTFVPNTITLNMPIGTDYSYRNGILTIKDLEHFDIIDGYHRYIALSNLYNMENSAFDYVMELRITNYTEAKCRQYIWQEDQKTKMSRIDSASMNAGSSSNKVVQRLNSNPITNLNGCINSNGGIINAAELAEIIKNTYFSAGKIFSKKQELIALRKAEDEISQGLKYVTEEDPNLLEHHWDRFFLYCLVYNISKGIDNKKLLSKTQSMAKVAKEEKMFRVREISRVDLRRLTEMVI